MKNTKAQTDSTATALATTPTDRLVHLYQNGNLLTKGITENGNAKALSMARIGKSLALPLSMLIKPINITMGGTKDKFRVKVLEWNDDSYHVLFEARARHTKPQTFEARLQMNSRKTSYTVKTFAGSGQEMENPYGVAHYQTIPAKVLASAANQPLIQMLKAGKISQRQLAIVIFAYLGAKSDKMGISLDAQTSQTLGKIIFTVLLSESSAEYYTLKDFLENFFELDWDAIADIVDTENQSSKLLDLPSF